MTLSFDEQQSTSLSQVLRFLLIDITLEGIINSELCDRVK